MTVSKTIRPGVCMMAALLLLTGCGSVAPDCEGLIINNLWIREAPPGASVQAGYFDAYNPTGNDIRLVAIESPDFDRVEMHETIRDGDGMAMRPIDTATVPPIATLNFQPGGKHLMLFSPRLQYSAGDKVEVVFVCGAEKARFPMAASIRRDS